MDDPIPPLPPPMLLAISYTPVHLRERLRWLLQFDRRMAQLVEKAAEPIFAQMRLAWWRDTLAKPAAARPKGEPLLAALHELEDDPVLLVAASPLVDAAELNVAGEADMAKAERSGAITKAYANWVGADRQMAEKLAFAWAGQGDDSMTSYPRALRPLTILAMAERLEANARSGAGLRLVWHALTGR